MWPNTRAKPTTHHRAARAEYLNALQWFGQRSRQAGDGFEQAFADALDAVTRLPRAYALIDGTHRQALVPGYPYLVVYRVTARGGVRVLAVAHSARAPGYWAGRK